MKQKAASAQKVANVFDLLGIDPKALPELGLVERTYPAGAVLAPAGQPGDEAFLIAAGQVRVSVDISGEEALGICHEGEFVGEMALLDRAPRSASLIAHEGPATVFVFSKYVFDALLDKSPKGAARLLAGMATALSIRLEAAFAQSTSFYIMSGGTWPGFPVAASGLLLRGRRGGRGLLTRTSEGTGIRQSVDDAVEPAQRPSRPPPRRGARWPRAVTRARTAAPPACSRSSGGEHLVREPTTARSVEAATASRADSRRYAPAGTGRVGQTGSPSSCPGLESLPDRRHPPP
jgi:CRP-like cAMP-binding protein